MLRRAELRTALGLVACLALSSEPVLAQGSAASAPAVMVGVMGRKVANRSGKDIGRIVDVLVDAAGQPRAAVIDFGGFLGVGARKIAVDWSNLHFPAAGAEDDRISVDLDSDVMKVAPEYSDGRPAAIVGPASETASAPPVPPPVPSPASPPASTPAGPPAPPPPAR